MKKDIINLIKGYMRDESMEVSGESSILFDLGLNSFDLVQVVCALEEKYDIEINDSEMVNFRSIDDVVKCIENKLLQHV